MKFEACLISIIQENPRYEKVNRVLNHKIMDCVLKMKLQGTDLALNLSKFVEMSHINIKVAMVIFIILYILMNSNAIISRLVN